MQFLYLKDRKPDIGWRDTQMDNKQIFMVNKSKKKKDNLKRQTEIGKPKDGQTDKWTNRERGRQTDKLIKTDILRKTSPPLDHSVGDHVNRPCTFYICINRFPFKFLTTFSALVGRKKRCESWIFPHKLSPVVLIF